MSFLLVGPGGYATVQLAVNAAVHGDTVGVQNGTYPEAISWNNKFLFLVGLGDAVLLTGAGGGAAPCISITGTGGGILERLTCSNVGSAHTDVLTLNVYQHICRRVRVNGTGGKVCFRAQYLDNCIAYNGANGFRSSCPGENILRNFTVATMTGQGIICNASNGTVQNCLVVGTVGGSIVNHNTATSFGNVTTDGIIAGANGLALTVAEVGFVNLAGGDLRLTDQSLAWFDAVPQMAVDFTGRRRRRFGTPTPRAYAGAYDPWPTGPLYASGGASVRKF